MNLLLRMHPLQRILISLIAALATFFYSYHRGLAKMLVVTMSWDIFALFYLIMSWIVIAKRSPDDIIKVANKDDGSRGFVLVSIVISSFASLFAVFLLMMFKPGLSIALPTAIFGMGLSWVMVHSLFTFHYAHKYFEGFEENKEMALDFPGEKKPDYLDFAYFSFTIGMTFQVSDVSVCDKKMRRVVLGHSILAFILNTFVVALTINLIAGLRK